MPALKAIFQVIGSVREDCWSCNFAGFLVLEA